MVPREHEGPEPVIGPTYCNVFTLLLGPRGQETRVLIGRAYRDVYGEIQISLSALPITGKLVIGGLK